MSRDRNADPKKTRDRLLAVVRRRIELDRRALSGDAHESTRRWLRLVSSYLTDPRLDVKWAKEQLGIRDHNHAIAFHTAAGLPPARYVELGRLDVAFGLVALTDVHSPELAALTGYRSASVVRRALKRRVGVSQRRLRRTYRRHATTPLGAARRAFRARLEAAAGDVDGVTLRGADLTARVHGRRRPLVHRLLASARRSSPLSPTSSSLALWLGAYELGLHPAGAEAVAGWDRQEAARRLAPLRRADAPELRFAAVFAATLAETDATTSPVPKAAETAR